ncbi:MAG: hypothetical protein H7Y43_11855 [Akkermansiaceae bacterium]|nr:hypothetical protein [Verrucomicrobiales bacterium]
MIVYGDAHFSLGADSFLEEIRKTLECTSADSLEALRSLLIQIGQLEQGLADAALSSSFPNPAVLIQARDLTDLAAGAFVSAWVKTSTTPTPISESWQFLSSLSEKLDSLKLPGNLSLTVNLPEGFEIHALYPEQYCVSVWKWARDYPGDEPIVVLGIRSIGTTLSAVAVTMLRMLGREALRITARPDGNPLQRRIELPPLPQPDFRHALVIDEWPGASDSSMAAAVVALRDAGLKSIFCFPGHEEETGAAASETLRQIWAETPRYFTRVDELKWNRLSLLENLSKKTSSLLLSGEEAATGAPGTSELQAPWRFIYGHAVQSLFGVSPDHRLPDSFDLIQDCSGGNWRQFAFRSEDDWPAVTPRRERIKFRCSDHEGHSVLWKFLGLGSRRATVTGWEHSRARMARLAAKGFTVKPLGAFQGFLALPWIEGTRLTRAHGIDSHLLRCIGEYILASAEPPLPSAEKNSSVLRLAEMLFNNTREAFGESSAGQTRRWARLALATDIRASAGDGHLAPHEWILPDALPSKSPSNILKLDCEGHSFDPTIIGPQPLYWDLAGAMVEWDLDYTAAAPLFAAIRHAGLEIVFEALKFYELAYAAFQMGSMSLTLSQTPESAERRRIQSAFFYYQGKLATGLKIEALVPGSGR